MLVPYSWLQEFIAELPDVHELGDLLNGLGLAVEEVTEYPGAPAGTRVVRIEEISRIPESDHLWLATVSDGESTHQLVTGAPNTRAGLLTAFAPPGTYLPSLGVTVEAKEMAGVESQGMLLSPRELGVHEYAGGLIEFSADTALGAGLSELWPGDTLIELELTPNRADAFSLLGVARDLAAKLDVPLRHPAAGLDQGDPSVEDGLRVDVQDRQGSGHFTLRRVDDLQVGPSPVWLQRKLSMLGLRPRNNVVDVTNLVTFELGQPSHAYDVRALGEDTIQVRRAREGERLVVLGGDELELQASDLVIATPALDGSRAIGLAGVMGGEHYSVEEDTTSVALEVAWFDPVSVRKTAKRHGQHTDAHYRFERGVDPALPPLASARAVQLLAQVAGGKPHPGISVAGGFSGRPPVRYRPERVHFLMDFDVEPTLQASYLERLGCKVVTVEEGVWEVTPPSWRFDMSIEEDVVEEVARLHGYEHIGETVPVMHFVPPATDATHRKLREQLAGLGFQEAISYVFTSRAELERSAAPPPVVELANPQGAEKSVLRTALYPGLLQAAALNRKRPGVALFEVGRIFLEEELERLALLVTGNWWTDTWQRGRQADFYLFKGLLESLARRRNATFELVPAQEPHLHPGISAQVLWNGEPVGSMGKLHPTVARSYELKDVYVAQLALPLEAGTIRYRDIPRQQYNERDLAIVAPRDVSYAALRELVSGAAGELLVSVEPFDVYEGAPIEEGRRSVALRLHFRHEERSLRDEEVDGFMESVVAAVREAGFTIRE